MLRIAGMLGGALLGFTVGGYIGGLVEISLRARLGIISTTAAVLGAIGGAMLIRWAWPKNKRATVHRIRVGDDEK